MALLGIGLTLAQNTSPASDPSNSSNSTNATQGQNTDSHSSKTAHSGKTMADKPSKEHKGVPSGAVEDQQNSTTSTTGENGENNTPATSTMGTSSNGRDTRNPDGNRNGSTAQPVPQSEPPADQQPNPSAPPHANNMGTSQTPATRAMATHTPDPGTCMNPAAMQTTQTADGAMAPRTPNCD